MKKIKTRFLHLVLLIVIALAITACAVSSPDTQPEETALPRSAVEIAEELIQNVTSCPGVTARATGEVPEIAAIVPDWNTATYRHAWLIECEDVVEYHWITWHYDENGTSTYNIKSIKFKGGN